MDGNEKRERGTRERQALDDRKPEKAEGLTNQNVTGPASIPVQRQESADPGKAGPAQPQGETRRPSP